MPLYPIDTFVLISNILRILYLYGILEAKLDQWFVNEAVNKIAICFQLVKVIHPKLDTFTSQSAPPTFNPLIASTWAHTLRTILILSLCLLQMYSKIIWLFRTALVLLMKISTDVTQGEMFRDEGIF